MAGSSVVGIGALCYYGAGLSKEVSAMDRAALVGRGGGYEVAVVATRSRWSLRGRGGGYGVAVISGCHPHLVRFALAMAGP